MTGFRDHFSHRSADYAAYRPVYPPALVDYLADVAPRRQLALDTGCGTGQLSIPLARRFDRVVATDASEAQIANAAAHEGVAFRRAAADRSGLNEGCVDLVTAAQAAHWFDLSSFYGEARRVARTGAVIALVTYGIIHVEGAARDGVLQQFYRETVGPYWPPDRRHVEDGYRSLPFPFEELPAPPLAMVAAWTLAELLGYVATWSAVKRAASALGRSPVAALEQQIGGVWGDARERKLVHWPLSLRVGRIV